MNPLTIEPERATPGDDNLAKGPDMGHYKRDRLYWWARSNPYCTDCPAEPAESDPAKLIIEPETPGDD